MKDHHVKKACILLLAVMAVFVLLPACCYAAETSDCPFSVEMVTSADQIDSVGYYHVSGESGQQITLQAKLTNLTDQSVEVKVVPMNAYSSQTGIFYQTSPGVDSGLYELIDERYGLAQYMEAVDPITLSANQTEVVSFSIDVPDLDVGTLLGCIRFVSFEGTHEVQEANEETDTSQILVDEYQAIDTPIKIDLPESDESATSIGDAAFDGDNLKVNFEIINQAAMVQENISGTYEVCDKDGSDLFDGTIDTFKMAPMTGFRYSIPWQYGTLEAGTYTLSGKLNVNGEETDFVKSFVIDETSIQASLNTQAKANPEIKSSSFPWPWIVVGFLAIVIIVLLFVKRKPPQERK
jgi:hypothetical protein